MISCHCRGVSSSFLSPSIITGMSVGKAVGDKPEVMLTKSDFPLFVKDGVPMVGINSVSDVSQLLVAVGAGYQPELVKGVDDIFHKSWDYETGKAEAGIKLMSK